MGHSTWDTYSSMVKLYKHYHFSLHLPGVVAYVHHALASASALNSLAGDANILCACVMGMVQYGREEQGQGS